MTGLSKEEEIAQAVAIVRYLNKEMVPKWSQERIAREIGVSLKTVVRWLKGTSKPSPLAIDRIFQLAKSCTLMQLKLPNQ